MINNNAGFQLINAETRRTESYLLFLWLCDEVTEVRLIAASNNTITLIPPGVVLSTTGGSEE